MITPLPGATPLKPGSATKPFFGVLPAVLNEQGKELEGAAEGWVISARSLHGQKITIESLLPGVLDCCWGCGASAMVCMPCTWRAAFAFAILEDETKQCAVEVLVVRGKVPFTVERRVRRMQVKV